MIPTFTAQLRGPAFERVVPLLKTWGIRGLDLAGVEPDEPDAERTIYQYINLAIRNGMALFGGSDYRGTGTGWIKHNKWMNHPTIRTTCNSLAQKI